MIPEDNEGKEACVVFVVIFGLLLLLTVFGMMALSEGLGL